MRVGVVGNGSFGEFFADELAGHFDVTVFDPNRPNENERIKTAASLTDIASCEGIVVAVPLGGLEKVIKELAPDLRPGTTVLDVTSVKVRPAEILAAELPDTVTAIATHPLFGPQSAQDGIAGHRIVMHPVHDAGQYERTASFFNSLGLKVIEMTPDEHDREMARVHALSFFIGRGLLRMGLEDSPLSTGYFRQLLGLENLERSHSWELFMTIQKGNPHADGVRREFLATLEALHEEVGGSLPSAG